MKLDIQLFGYYDGDVEIKVIADTKEFDQGLDKIQSSTQKAGSTVKNIVAGLGITKLVGKAFQVINASLDDAITRFDTLNNFPKVMSNLGIGAKAADKEINRMSEALAGLPTTLDQGALAVQRFTSKNGDVKKSTDIFLALNNAILAGGANTQIQASALEQLSQSYSKGKMDMMEWRTVQMAMPAQLKQVATAMGVTTDQLGEMLREGDNTSEAMDKFMNTIIALNKNGINGFQSFEKQARNSTGGIQTAITVAKTQVVKGVTDMITGINKGLKKSKLPSLSEIIAKVGKEAKKQLDGIAKMLAKIDFKALLDVVKKLIPVVGTLVAGFVAYEGVLKAITAINFAKNLTSAISAVVGLTSATNLSAGAMTIFNAVISANPVGLLVAGITALGAGMIYLTTQTTSLDKEIEKSNQTLNEYNNSMKKIDKQREEMLSKSMGEIYHYQALKDELKEIVDENGRVKAGYEDRANFIATELKNSLGVEIGLTDGIITNYQDIQKEIEETIAKKKAMTFFTSHEEQYNEALKQESSLQKEIETNATKRDKSLKTINTTLDEAIMRNKELKDHKKELLQYYKGEIEWGEVSAKTQGLIDNMMAEHNVTLASAREKYIAYNEQLEKSNETYASNQLIIKEYEKAEEELAQGHYDAVQKIFNDTVTFNGKTQEENNKKYENEKTKWDAYLKYLKEHHDKYGDEYIKSEKERIANELETLDTERKEANEKIKEKNKELLNTTLTGVQEQINQISSKKVEFKRTANGNIQAYIDGQKEGQPMTEKEAKKMADKMIEKIKSVKKDAKKAGVDLTAGTTEGIENGQGGTYNAVQRYANSIISTLKKTLKIHSPSKITEGLGLFFTKGFDEGLDDGKSDTLKGVKEYGEDIIDQLNATGLGSAFDDIYGSMQRAVDIETGKISANVELGNASKSLSQMITANASFEGTIPVQVDLDGEKIWENQQKVSQRKSIQYGGVR